jgi:hypothetical protein
MRIRSSALGLALALLLPLSANAESATPSSAATSDQGDASNPATMAFYNDVEDVLQDPKTELGEDFAGAWIDSTDRQVVNVAFKGEDASRNAKSDPKKSKLANDERVRFVALRFSTRDLAKTSAHAVGTLVKLLKGSSPKDGLFTVTVNTQENMIDVDIDSAVSDRKDEIDKEFAKDIEAGTIRIAYDREVEQIDDGPNTCLPETGTESLVTRQNCQPTRGGLVLTMASGGSCTSGFVFKSTFGVRYLSTAGHCGYTGISYSHGGTEIGDSIFSSRIDGNSIDASLIDYENENIALPNNSIFRYGASDTRITTKITAPDTRL